MVSETSFIASVRKFASKRVFLGLLISQLVFVAIAGGRAAGLFQPLELRVYDLMIQFWSARGPVPRSPVILIGATEADLNRFGWPLSDRILARLLYQLAEAGPRAIGVDIYRDRSRPPGAEDLAAVLTDRPNIVMIYLSESGRGDGIPPPEVLAGTPQTGFADIVRDADGTVRRSLLYVQDAEGELSWSFPFMLAYHYLQPDDIGVGASPRDESLLTIGPTTLIPAESDSGPYVGVDAGGYQIPLDFRNGYGGFPIHSISDVVDGRVDVETISDAVLIVGTTAESVKDDFFTPLAGPGGGAPAIFGIELHGHTVSQLVRNARGLTPSPEAIELWQVYAWIWAWCGLAGFVLQFARGAWQLALACIVLGGAPVGVTVAAFGHYHWLPAALPALGALSSLSAGATAFFFREQRDRRTLMELFSRNVSPAVAESLWRQRDAFMDGNRPASVDLMATVLFTDLKGFTSVSEGMNAADLLVWLNEYMSEMTEIVDRNGGVVDKIIGDAVMAVFGVPVPRASRDALAQDAIAAVECALEMGARLDAMNAEWADQGQPVVGMRVGIETGPLVAGSLGGRQRLNYTVIGDTVNTAARLESYDKNIGSDLTCRVLIGQRTKDMIGDGYRLRAIGSVALKGKTETTSIYLVEARNLDKSGGGFGTILDPSDV